MIYSLFNMGVDSVSGRRAFLRQATFVGAALLAGTGVNALNAQPVGEPQKESEPIAPPSSGDLLIVQGNYQYEPTHAKALLRRHLPENTDAPLLPQGDLDIRQVHGLHMRPEVAVVHAPKDKYADPFMRNIRILNGKTGQVIKEQLFSEDRLLPDDMSWSSDGKSLTFTDYLSDGSQRIAVVDIGSGELKHLPLPYSTVFAPQFHPTNPNVLLINKYDGNLAAVMSDEELKALGMKPKDIEAERAKLAGSSSDTNQVVEYPSIISYNIETGERKEVGEGYYGQWSPDGTMIACSFRLVNSNTGIESRVFDATQTNVQVADIPGTTDPHWATDGETVSCVRLGTYSGRSVQAVTFVNVKTGYVANNNNASFDTCNCNWIDSNWVAVTGDWDDSAFPYTIVLHRNGVDSYTHKKAPKEQFEKGFGFLPDWSHQHLPIQKN